MVAFSNSGGGMICIGVTDNGAIAGLEPNDVARLNQLISNAASQSVRPPVDPRTENIALAEGVVMVVHVPPGVSRPYMDHEGAVFVKPI